MSLKGSSFETPYTIYYKDAPMHINILTYVEKYLDAKQCNKNLKKEA